MVKMKGYSILGEEGDFLTLPAEIFRTKQDAQEHAKNIAKDLDENYKDYKIVKSEIKTI